MDHVADSPPPVQTEVVPRTNWVIVGCLLMVHFLLAVTATLDKCTTFDEIAHLTAGYSYWLNNDYRMQPENGNLPQRWAALPLLVSRPAFPGKDQQAWLRSDVWETGGMFFYDSGNDPDQLLLQGRAMIALLGVALGLTIFLYTRKLFGPKAGLFSLTLFAFCPSMLAHGALVTSDVAASLFFLLSLWSSWWVFHEVRARSLLVSGLALAGLFLSKFSAVIILPVLVLLALGRVVDGRPVQIDCCTRLTVTLRRRLFAVIFGVFVVQALVVVFMIWAFFGLRFSAFAEPQAVEPNFYKGGWNGVLDGFGLSPDMDDLIVRARNMKLLPEGYLFGFAFTLRFAQARNAFFNGEIGNTGWPEFFPYAFLVKTPLPTLLILLLAALAWWISWLRQGFRQAFHATAPLWIFLVVFWAFAIRSHLNIGHRHILPAYPALFVLAGAAARWWRWPSLKFGWSALLAAVVLNASLAWLVVESVARWPNYLAYFNQVVGGPKNGYKHFVDSSLDWGQDLPGLKRWLTEQGLDGDEKNVYLYYFGTGDTKYYGIHAKKLPLELYELPDKLSDLFAPGVYCMSATYLQGVYQSFQEWNEKAEHLFQAGLVLEKHFDNRKDPESQRFLTVQFGRDNWLRIANTIQLAKLARLRNYLKEREPDDQIGYSILIYRVTEDDLKRAFEPRGPVSPELIPFPAVRKKGGVNTQGPKKSAVRS